MCAPFPATARIRMAPAAGSRLTWTVLAGLGWELGSRTYHHCASPPGAAPPSPAGVQRDRLPLASASAWGRRVSRRIWSDVRLPPGWRFGHESPVRQLRRHRVFQGLDHAVGVALVVVVVDDLAFVGPAFAAEDLSAGGCPQQVDVASARAVPAFEPMFDGVRHEGQISTCVRFDQLG